MEVTSQWAVALENNITHFTKDGFATHPDSTTEVFNISNSKNGIIRFHNSWGPRIVPKANENASTHEANVQKGYETISSPQVFKEKISISKEMASRNMYPEIMRLSKDLGSAGIESVNLYGNGIFINTFSTSYTAYGDLKPLTNIEVLKSILIYGENPEMDNASEGENHRQRLNELTLFNSDVIVRTMAII